MSTKRTATTLAAAGLTVIGATLGITTMVDSQAATAASTSTSSSTASTSSTSTSSDSSSTTSNDQSTAVNVAAGSNAPAASTSGS